MENSQLSVSQGAPRQSDRSVPRLLLVTEIPPSDSHVGGIFLRDLCAFYPADKLSVCVIANESFEWPASLAHVRFHTVKKPPSHGLFGFGRHVTRLTRPVFEPLVRSTLLPRLAEQVTAIARTDRAELVWIPLVGPATIGTAERIADSLRLPLVTTVWDTPETYLYESTGLTSARSRMPYLRRFAGAMRRSVRCGVMSEAMAATYAEAYGTSPVIMRHGIAARRWRAPVRQVDHSADLLIGYAGSLYARKEWDALLAALHSVNWKVADRTVSIRIFCDNIRISSRVPVRIEFRGWNSVEETTLGLSVTDLCYLPYWFDKEHQITARLAFPTKLTTYLASGSPVLFHGPSDASPARFLARYPAGVSCHSHEPHDIIAALTRLVDPDFRAHAAGAMSRACEEELGLHVFRKRFADLVGVPDSYLNPIG